MPHRFDHNPVVVMDGHEWNFPLKSYFRLQLKKLAPKTMTSAKRKVLQRPFSVSKKLPNSPFLSLMLVHELLSIRGGILGNYTHCVRVFCADNSAKAGARNFRHWRSGKPRDTWQILSRFLVEVPTHDRLTWQLLSSNLFSCLILLRPTTSSYDLIWLRTKNKSFSFAQDKSNDIGCVSIWGSLFGGSHFFGSSFSGLLKCFSPNYDS